MALRKMAKKLLPPVVVDAIRWMRNRDAQTPLQQYLQDGRIPWSAGYGAYKGQFIMQVLADKSLLTRFRSGEPLPPAYGVGIDERCIEYPWLLANLADSAEVLLDAGSTLNWEFILDHPLLRRKVIHILTLAPEANCFWHKGISYLFHDLRDIPIRDGYYDTIVCLSTLEHVGCDNTLYTSNPAHREHRSEDFVLAMRELHRVLKPGGTLLFTVPFGVYRHFGTFQQFDQKLLVRAIEAFGPANEIERFFYRYTAEGWDVASMEECAESEYVEWITRPHDPWPDPPPVEPDLAAAARAVACVRLVKGSAV